MKPRSSRLALQIVVILLCIFQSDQSNTQRMCRFKHHIEEGSGSDINYAQVAT